MKHVFRDCCSCGLGFRAEETSAGDYEVMCVPCSYGLPVNEVAMMPNTWAMIVAHCVGTYDDLIQDHRFVVRELRKFRGNPSHGTCYSIDVEYSKSGHRALFGVGPDGVPDLWQD